MHIIYVRCISFTQRCCGLDVDKDEVVRCVRTGLVPAIARGARLWQTCRAMNSAQLVVILM
jgi:hypothetical protein